MADKAASVLTKLKNKAKESGRSYQLCLQLFCQEEFLRRLENSRYANNFVLKGGLFIYTLTEFESRVTMDIDFLLQRLPNTPQQLKTVIEEKKLNKNNNDYISFEVRNIQPIAVTKKYAGITASLMAKIKNTKTPINIDFGVGDVIIPRQEKRAIPTQLAEFEKPVVNTYSLETTIAEKIDDILDFIEYSSRMKDYYDIYYLSKHFEFDSEILSEAMRKTFANRNHSFSKEQFDQVMQFGTNPEMKKKWHFFARKININDIDFEEVMREIKEFLEESFIKSC